MFTGIVEEIGVIKGIKKGEKSSKLFIKANKVLNQMNVGDSIATMEYVLL
ncbi:lumazine binding domain protein [[Clostridium] sordellii ATCC 9714]|nr:lumazine binding domain protein [[Clostridium] sordellii ATCC 9714] [Paeniclostridium sordellii ATCC 9714]